MIIIGPFIENLRLMLIIMYKDKKFFLVFRNYYVFKNYEMFYFFMKKSFLYNPMFCNMIC